MLRNYLTVAYRNLLRRKGYAFINVAGLGVGIAACVLIGLFVRQELSFDRFHEHADGIYRIESDWGGFSLPSTNWRFVEALKTDHPGLELTHFIRNEASVRVTPEGGEPFAALEDNVLFAPPSFFEVFSFGHRGDPAVLAQPNTAFITEEVARKYFGGEDPVGKTMTVYSSLEVTVRGVLDEVPVASHFHPDVIVSWSTLQAAFNWETSQGWGNNSVYTYVLFPDRESAEIFAGTLPATIERHAGEKWNGSTLSIRPLTDIHLNSHRNMELEANGKMMYVWTFSLVALAILLLACVNFMNLATARSVERTKEVGVRKTLGAVRGQLVGQFLTESVLLAVFALLVAGLLVVLTIPQFEALTGRPLGLDPRRDAFALGALALVALVTGVAAGSYPAFFLSRYRPAAVLRGPFRAGREGTLLRKGLVVFQFAVSAALLFATVVVYNQLQHLRKHSVGFDQEQVLVVNTPTIEGTWDWLSYGQRLASHTGAAVVGGSSERLPGQLLDGAGFHLDGENSEELEKQYSVSPRFVRVSPGFFEALGVEMVEGRPFSTDFATDSSAFVINEAAARIIAARSNGRLNGPADLVGERAHHGIGNVTGPIIGVTSDFNIASLHVAVDPMVFVPRNGRLAFTMLRLPPGDPSRAIAGLEALWKEQYPGQVLTYEFADRSFAAAYDAEERLGRLVFIFAGLAVFVACLGLFGLAAFTAQQRTKEIGVRKVLGASVASIIALLSKDFARLIVIAFVIAAPLGYYAMSRWLEDFAYRTGIGAGTFVLAAVITLFVALLAVGYQAVRAATIDPVKSLRYE